MGDYGPSTADVNPAYYPNHATTAPTGPDAPEPGEGAPVQNPTTEEPDPAVHGAPPGTDGSPDDGTSEGNEEDGYDDMTKDQLQEELRAQGKSTSGNKDELVARLRNE